VQPALVVGGDLDVVAETSVGAGQRGEIDGAADVPLFAVWQGGTPRGTAECRSPPIWKSRAGSDVAERVLPKPA